MTKPHRDRYAVSSYTYHAYKPCLLWIRVMSCLLYTSRAEKLPEISAAQSVAEGVCPLHWCLELVKAARVEACGKSVMCRDGLWQLQLMIEGCMRGQSKEEDLSLIHI